MSEEEAPRQGKRWTREEEAYLRRAYSQGLPGGRIAAHLGRTAEAVKVRAHRLGLKHPRLAPDPSPGDGDLARRLMRIQGLEAPEEDGPPEVLPAELLEGFLEGPEPFLDWLGVPLHDYQREALRLIQGNPRTVLCWSRQAGKDHVTSAYALWTALVQPGAIVVCVSPAQRQSDLWLARLKERALARRELRDALVDLSQTEVALSNGARVHSLPSGVSGGVTIRGFSRVSLLLFNEAAWVEEDVYRAASPFLAASEDGKVVLISTPFGESGYFWRAWTSELFARSHVPASEVPHIDPGFLERERATMDGLSFAAEYEARFVSAADAYYPAQLVASCTARLDLAERPGPGDAERTAYLGFDPARVEGGDRSVLTVLAVDEEGLGEVRWIRAFEGVSYVDQAAYVAWLHGEWRFRRIHVDGSAHAVVDELRARGLPVEAVSFSTQGKVELHSRLKAALEARRIRLPHHMDLQRELGLFRYRISPAGNLLLHGAGRDDHVDSLALAALPLTQARVPANRVRVIRFEGRDAYERRRMGWRP